MTPTPNPRIIFSSVPTGYPDETTLTYDTTHTIDLQNVSLDGGVLVKILELSIDPYMRGRMRDNVGGGIPPFSIGEPIQNFAIGVIVRSENDKFNEGEHVYGILSFVQYVIMHPNTSDPFANLRVMDNKYKLPWSVFIGAAGMPGQTAYMAWKEFSNAKKGETVFVSSGAGAVGSVVIQLAKKDGLKVIASAGSAEKVEHMKDCGADVAFNYKMENVGEVLKREGGIDIYWDNVGGETLDYALEHAKYGARFLECGMISGYNTSFAPIKNIFQIVAKTITVHGVSVHALHSKYHAQFYNEIPKMISEGQLKYKEYVWSGLEEAPEALIAVLNGKAMAKAVVHVADE